ncbi:hypothetical protein JZ751_024052 [Albula glossodonta]|uniref:Uncharacterized protein n=1 Tax=Albula glossodonta TaxID=121402 RepID=A0A8T2NF86_9TELE|nr:hypothetical protein JZ751_024052 [Albula glossodonta]
MIQLKVGMTDLDIAKLLEASADLSLFFGISLCCAPFNQRFDRLHLYQHYDTMPSQAQPRFAQYSSDGQSGCEPPSAARQEQAADVQSDVSRHGGQKSEGGGRVESSYVRMVSFKEGLHMVNGFIVQPSVLAKNHGSEALHPCAQLDRPAMAGHQTSMLGVTLKRLVPFMVLLHPGLDEPLNILLIWNDNFHLRKVSSDLEFCNNSHGSRHTSGDRNSRPWSVRMASGAPWMKKMSIKA